MKKIFAIIAAATLFAGAAQAQGLGDILGALGGNSNLGNTINSVIYAYTGNTTAVVLPGTWTYVRRRANGIVRIITAGWAMSWPSACFIPLSIQR